MSTYWPNSSSFFVKNLYKIVEKVVNLYCQFDNTSDDAKHNT